LELLLVVTIIGILAALVVPRFVGRTQQARIGGARQDIATLGTALDVLEQDVGRYPTTEEGLRVLIEGNNIKGWQGPYLKSGLIPVDPWGNQHTYRFPSEMTEYKTFYDLISGGPDGQVGGEDDITNHNATQQAKR
jgi:general secretion pathway protein G